MSLPPNTKSQDEYEALEKSLKSNNGSGAHDILIMNKKAGIYFTIPVNPNSIKWDGELVTQVQDVKSGYHYQFIKYRRTAGSLRINTGAAKNIYFANEWFTRVRGKPTGNCRDAHDYMMRLGTIVEYWMLGAVQSNVGPMTMTDNFNEAQPISFKILFNGYPQFGLEAGRTSFQIQLSFEIVENYEDKYDQSSLSVDVLPPLARAKDILYTVSGANETVETIAKKFYGDTKYAVLLRQIQRNNPYITSDGKIKKGSQIIIPYFPLSREYKTPSDTIDSGSGLSGTVGDFLGGAGDWFNELLENNGS